MKSGWGTVQETDLRSIQHYTIDTWGRGLIKNMKKIVIGLPHLTEKIDARFADSLIGLVAHSLRNGLEIVRIATYRDNITFARNKIASLALEENADYLFFLDDDMVFDPDILLKLLEQDKDIVGALTFIRSEPHEPSFYELNSDGDTYNPIFLWKPKEVVKCDAVGMAATLIKKSVLEALRDSNQYHKGIYGFYDNLNFSGEDLRFCRKAREAGFEIYCDTGVLVGHLTQKIISFGDFKAMSDNRVKEIFKERAIKDYEK